MFESRRARHFLAYFVCAVQPVTIIGGTQPIPRKMLTLDYTAMAKKIGLSVDTIRFYERSCLLAEPPRTPGGYRKYGESDVETLAFIRRVHGLGFTLREVRELLDLRRSRLRPCAPVRGRLEKKVSEVHLKLADLRKLERELRTALRNCNREMRERSAHCPLLAESGQRKLEAT